MARVLKTLGVRAGASGPERHCCTNLARSTSCVVYFVVVIFPPFGVSPFYGGLLFGETAKNFCGTRFLKVPIKCLF